MNDIGSLPHERDSESFVACDILYKKRNLQVYLHISNQPNDRRRSGNSSEIAVFMTINSVSEVQALKEK